ncbi:hypothetical protein HUU39_23295 [candidate division KSB1 bacterium]|nr:hypothetical protein [candidate division KSB1 bacterium]
MILVEYLVWILVVCYGYFVVLRLFWLYRERDKHIVWKRADAGLYYGLALLNFLTMLSLFLLQSRPVYLLLLLIGTYVFCAVPVVKVNTRGIMMTALLTHLCDSHPPALAAVAAARPRRDGGQMAQDGGFQRSAHRGIG